MHIFKSELWLKPEIQELAHMLFNLKHYKMIRSLRFMIKCLSKGVIISTPLKIFTVISKLTLKTFRIKKRYQLTKSLILLARRKYTATRVGKSKLKIKAVFLIRTFTRHITILMTTRLLKEITTKSGIAKERSWVRRT